MKLWEFDQLCRTEWDNGRGEVCSLWLLEKSIRELQDDILSFGAGMGKALPLRVADIPRLRQGDRPMYVVHPLTRGEIRLRIARDMDVADIKFPDGHFESHVLARSA